MHFLQVASMKGDMSDLTKKLESLRVKSELLEQKINRHGEQYDGAQDKSVCTDKEPSKADSSYKGIQTDSALPQVYWIPQLFALRNSGNSRSGYLYRCLASIVDGTS